MENEKSDATLLYSLSKIKEYAQELLRICDKENQIHFVELILSACSLSSSPSFSLSLSSISLSSSPEQSNNNNNNNNNNDNNNNNNYEEEKPLIPKPINKWELFKGTSPYIDLLLSRDWASTSMGPVETWTPQLRSLIDTMMMSEVAMMLLWGPELYTIYNKGHSYIHGSKHPKNFGLPYSVSWPEMWAVVSPIFKLAMPGGKSMILKDHYLESYQNSQALECYYTWSQSPVFIEDGSIGGLFVTCLDTTSNVIGRRRTSTLYELNLKSAASNVMHVIQNVTAELVNHPKDIPFSLIYLRESEHVFILKSMQGLQEGHKAAPKIIDLNDPESVNTWPLAAALNSSGQVIIADVLQLFGDIKGTEWPESIKHASVQPLYTSDSQTAFGICISAFSPRNILDDEYKRFQELVVLQISASIATGHSREQERLKAEDLAENDRLRTAFFHNISHELRTPLMLMLGPLESVLSDATLQPDTRSHADLVFNNTHRLRRLVNSLLDFAKVEAKVSKGHFSSVDICEITKNFACVFKEATEQAGLEFVMKLPDLNEEVYLDPDMWELVVSNLLSNALKFTQSGKIEVEIRRNENFVEMIVADTGVGIMPQNVSKVFSRFSNFKTDFNRTNEGTGIGLSLTRELIRLHGGVIEVSSEAGRGSTFTVKIPVGKDHLPTDQVTDTSPSSAVKFLTDLRVKATSSNNNNNNNNDNDNDSNNSDNDNNKNNNDGEKDQSSLLSSSEIPPKILLVDDNADMRKYIGGLLRRQGWEISLACDGEEAYQKAIDILPDLVVSDVMMPKLSGFQLLSFLRENKTTCHIPIILLSARGGEDAQLEGLKMGADDYLLKPCSEAQIIVRVNLHLELGRLRANLQREVNCRMRELGQAYASLRASEEEFRSLASLSPVGIVRIRDGKVFYTNERWAQITGVHEYSEMGVWEMALHPDDCQRVLNMWKDFREKTIKTFSEEIRYIKPEGKLTYALIEANYIAGEEDGCLVVATDITEIKDLEQQRMVAITKAEEEQRRRAQDAEYHKQLQEQFVNTICHEIRNPLNGIYNNAQLLQTSIKIRTDALHNASVNSETRRMLSDVIQGDSEAVEAIFACAAHQKMVTNDVLDMSKIDAGNMIMSELPFDAVKTVTTTSKMFFTEMSSKGIELKTELPDSVPVLGDNNRLSQVLINLLSNSIKFTANAPVKIIKVSLSSESVSSETVKLSISVTDSGLGMTEEEQALIFERFKQGNKDICTNYGGHGLGLYICKNLVELMNGTIRVKSVRNSGTTISVTIICKKCKEGANGKSQELSFPLLEPSLLSHKRNILLVEDNPINQKVLLRQLTKLGHTCIIANNGKEAIDKLLPSNEANYDVVLMDIQMPIMDGLQATKIIRQQEDGRLHNIPIIGLSGNATKTHINEAIEAGMLDFVTKPYEINDLLQKIENVIV